MSYSGELKHLSVKDKKNILEEISFFLSPKGFIDGVALMKRMSNVLDYPIENGTEKYMKELLEARKRGRNG